MRGAIPIDALAADPAVEAVNASGTTLRVLLAPGAGPLDVLRALDGHGGLVAGMRVERPHLGDAFLRITGHPLDGRAP
jgi:hypothetical protein